MRFLIAAAAIALLAVPAHADTMAHCSAAWTNKTVAAKAAGTYQAWSKVCLAKTYSVPAAAPVGTPAPAGSTGQCKDGTYTMAKNHQGACSNHGGVAKWL
jgi:hypothetical protein